MPLVLLETRASAIASRRNPSGHGALVRGTRHLLPPSFDGRVAITRLVLAESRGTLAPGASRRHHAVVSYDPTIYEGAAAHYRYGRSAYSPQLEAVLTADLDLDGSGALLDAGCGPGILTVRIAHLSEEAVRLDPDPAMLAEGRRVAHERGIGNIRWVQALAEDLPRAAPGPYRVITFGQSFHWTDEARVAEAV